MGWVVNATPRPLYLRERHGTHCIRGWVGLRAGLDGCGKSRPKGIRSPDRPARSESPCRLSYPPEHSGFETWQLFGQLRSPLALLRNTLCSCPWFVQYCAVYWTPVICWRILHGYHSYFKPKCMLCTGKGVEISEGLERGLGLFKVEFTILGREKWWCCSGGGKASRQSLPLALRYCSRK